MPRSQNSPDLPLAALFSAKNHWILWTYSTVVYTGRAKKWTCCA